jgi:hypothetical protein
MKQYQVRYLTTSRLNSDAGPDKSESKAVPDLQSKRSSLDERVPSVANKAQMPINCATDRYKGPLTGLVEPFFLTKGDDES